MYWLHNEKGERVAEIDIPESLMSMLIEKGCFKITRYPPAIVTPCQDTTVSNAELYLRFVKAGYA